MKYRNIMIMASVIGICHLGYADEFNAGRERLSTAQVINILNKEVNNVNPINDSDYEGDINDQGNSRMIDMKALTHSGAQIKSTPPIKTARQSAATLKKSSSQRALSMEVLFGYKSSELTESAKDQLRPVGEALASSKLQSLNFIVEGHTDAVGGYAYNQILSENRAESVKNYFVTNYHVLPVRIKTLGKGKSELLDTQNPGSEVNRRVKIVALKP